MSAFNDEYSDLAKLAAMPVGQGRALPFECFTEQRIFQQEIKNIFSHDWVFACMAQELAQPGDYFAFDLANEPLVLIKGRDGEIRALSNLCRHRGTRLNDAGLGHRSRFTCPYHGWTYDDTGDLLAIPFQGAVDIDKSSHCLPGFPVCIWQGLVFVSLNPQAPSLTQRLAGLDDYFKRYNFDEIKAVTSDPSAIWQCNWKLALENAMESYHLFKVHAKTLEPTSPTKSAYYVEGSADWTVTGGEILGLDGFADKVWQMFGDLKAEVYKHYMLISIPPSFVGVLSVESFDWISVLPKQVEQCWVRGGTAFAGVAAGDDEADDLAAAFVAEDKAICERVQSGMTARHTTGGQLVDLERVVVDFHHYYAQRLFRA